VSTLPAREGYRLWAPSYDAETAVSALEDQTVAELGVPTAHERLLDVGCGTARRLRGTSAAMSVGVDLSPEMLGRATEAPLLAAADLRLLPFADASFDVVWCRLVIGHVRNLAVAYAELSRVCRAGGTVIVSDLCAEAVARGHRRTFRDATNAVHEVEHFVYPSALQVSVARKVGLELATRREAVVGPSIEKFYAQAGRHRAFEEQRGLPLVFVLVLRRMTP
jgi:malonyl-CoA O-methyltransferase